MLNIEFDHDLKIKPEFFIDIIKGSKKFELRKNDRGFKVGDELLLKVWNNEKYTGAWAKVEVIKEGGKW